MSLKIEQKLSQFQFSEKQPTLYATGVSLIPMKIEVYGVEKYVWVADEFKDDSFDLEGNSVSPRVISDKIEELYV